MTTRKSAAIIRYENKWNACTKCPLHQTAKTHVLYRGTLPADIFFLGEAPGKKENILGEPFVGPSGNILTETIEALQLHSFIIVNTVCCIPWAVFDKDIRPPSKEEITLCIDHVVELLELAKPRLFVTLGEVAKSHLSFLPQEKKPANILHLRHPAYVLRRGGSMSFEHKHMINTLQDGCRVHEIDHTPFFTKTSYAKSVKTN